LLLPGHPLDPCGACRGAAPVGSATHSPDGCGPSDRLSSCHGAAAFPSQSRTASATALHWVWRTPLAIYPGVESTDRRAAQHHAELRLRRTHGGTGSGPQAGDAFPHTAHNASTVSTRSTRRRRSTKSSTLSEDWRMDMNFEGQAQDLARCSRLGGPSRLGSSEGSWASGSP